MLNDLKTISQYKKEFKTGKMKVPAVLFSANNNLIKKELLERLEKMGENPEIFDHIAVLSDAHIKSNILNPTGSVVASRNSILPEMLDAAPNCGMRAILTDLTDNNLTPEKIKELFSELKTAIPSEGFVGTKVSNETVLNIFQKGSIALKDVFVLRTKNEFENTYKNGNFLSNCYPELAMPRLRRVSGSNRLDSGSEAGMTDCLETKFPSEKDISRIIPWPIRWLAKYRLGLLGATSSHFLYLMKVSEIKNPEIAERLKLKTGQYLFFMHTGSSIIGRYTASLFTRRKIKSISQRAILSFIKLFGVTTDKNLQEIAWRAVSNYGFANRTLITHKLDMALEKVFDRQIALDLLYDAPHVYFDHENLSEGDTAIVHRNGANRAFGPQRMYNHPIFSQTGEPALIAPFDGKSAYIGIGTNENTETFFSANHEIGKIKELDINPKESEEYAKKIIQEMEENKIIKTVAKLEAIDVLTY